MNMPKLATVNDSARPGRPPSPSYHRDPNQLVDQLRDRLRIAVIHGGKSGDEGAVIYRTHNPRSDKTYEAVAADIAESLRTLGFKHVELFADDMRLGERLKAARIDFAWLNTGGTQGYSPTCHAASMLELFGIPYLGHDPLNSALLDNKHAFKHLLAGLHIETAPFMTWLGARGMLKPRINSMFRKKFGDHGGPFIVKPISGRASINVCYAETVDDLPDIVQSVYEATNNLVLIETYLAGAEYCVAVCGPTVAKNGSIIRHRQPFCFSMVERRLDKDEHIFTSMDKRPITDDRIRVLDPGNEPDTIRKLEAVAQSVYLDCALESLVRLDLRADDAGRIFVLEANPKPDMKRPSGNQVSVITTGLEQEGMGYDDLVLSLIADRLIFLTESRPQLIPHIVDMLG